MATNVPEIRVSALFPVHSADAEHAQPPPWTWLHCLTFPLDLLNELQFASKPYKWIRYATGVVIGAQGDLSFDPNSPGNVMEYDGDLPSESVDLYYHVSDAEKRRMFPADPDMDRTNVTSSVLTRRRACFRRDVIERDRVCVLTGSRDDNCDAAHLLPHSRGDEYIENYTWGRTRDPAENDIVDKIDSVRNGVLLNKTAHCNFGENIAFLVTPNFAMSTADVDPTLPPTAKRCTAHCFRTTEDLLGTPFGFFPSGSPVRMPDAADRWPPDILFDAVYASAVLHHFAAPGMRGTLRERETDTATEEEQSAGQADSESIISERATKDARKDEQDRARDQRAAKRARGESNDRGDYMDFLMMLPYIMIPPEEVKAARRKAAEKKAERERSRVEDKVVGWAKAVANASQ